MKRLRITVEPHAAESQKEFIRENLGLYSEKFGYELFATLDECPPGHKLYFLKKQLAVGNIPATPKRRRQRPLTK